MDICLSQVEPDGWLPFVEDFYLCEWRDYLFPQLEPGAPPNRGSFFLSTGNSTPEFYALLASEERMQTEVFEHLPLQRVDITTGPG